MTTSVERVEGKLTNNAGDEIPVRLQLTVERLSGSDDVAVSECKLVAGKVPDGEYDLEYFYFKLCRHKIRVQFGVLVAASNETVLRRTEARNQRHSGADSLAPRSGE